MPPATGPASTGKRAAREEAVGRSAPYDGDCRLACPRPRTSAACPYGMRDDARVQGHARCWGRRRSIESRSFASSGAHARVPRRPARPANERALASGRTSQLSILRSDGQSRGGGWLGWMFLFFLENCLTCLLSCDLSAAPSGFALQKSKDQPALVSFLGPPNRGQQCPPRSFGIRGCGVEGGGRGAETADARSAYPARNLCRASGLRGSGVPSVAPGVPPRVLERLCARPDLP